MMSSHKTDILIQLSTHLLKIHKIGQSLYKNTKGAGNSATHIPKDFSEAQEEDFK
jgi:hypothetical protein